MPIQAPQWTEFLSCPVCCHEFDAKLRSPISLGCGHTVCTTCLSNLHRKQCPFDQTNINTEIDNLPVNFALLQLVGANIPDPDVTAPVKNLSAEDCKSYSRGKKCIEELALYLKPFSSGTGSGGSSALSRPMQRKLVTLINSQLLEDEGKCRAMRAARSLGERTVTELILQHQNPQQLSANLWAAVRARGCQFLGPAMQEEVLKLVLLALEDGSALSRKVVVMFVVQRLEPHFPQASKTSIGHVVQLLYRASCFKVSKREGDSSLMQLKEEFRTYEALRREHDAQIVQIATEAGLRIAPDQWSALLYGDTAHKSHMQSIIDKLQSPQSFAQSVQELVIALQRTGDPGNLSVLRTHLEVLASIDPSPDSSVPTWTELCQALEAVRLVVAGLVEFIQNHGSRKVQDPVHVPNTKYKISMCRDLTLKGSCPRGTNCTFAHSEEELERFRCRNRIAIIKGSPFTLGPLLDRIQEENRTVDNHGIRAEDAVYSTPTSTTPSHSFNTNTTRKALISAPVQTPMITSISTHSGIEYSSFTVTQPVTTEFQMLRHTFPPGSVTIPLDIYNSQRILLNNNLPATDCETLIDQSNAGWINSNKLSTHQVWTVPSKSDTDKGLGQSLAALQQRRQEIMLQLEKAKKVTAAATMGLSTPPAELGVTSPFVNTDNQGNTSAYSIWNSDVLLTGGESSTSCTNQPLTAIYRSDIPMDDEFVPFDPPIVSKYGPISRMANKAILHPNGTVQAAATFGDTTVSTPMVRGPVSATSSVASLYYNIQGFPSSAIGNENYITIGHGIIESPQLIVTSTMTPEQGSKLLIEESEKMKQRLQSLEKRISDLKIVANAAPLTESELLSQELQYIEQEIRVKEKENEMVPTSSNVWSGNGEQPSQWGDQDEGQRTTEGRRDHNMFLLPEDAYETGIANDMRELERRLQYELEEQEKRWSSDEDVTPQ